MSRLPAFQFYPKDYLSDGKQAAMSLAETGAYIRLLCVCWLEGSIPDDPARVGRIVGATPAQMRSIWPAVRACFTPASEPGHLVHPRLERERAKQVEFTRKQRENGLRGGRPQKPNGNPTHNPKETQPITQTEAKKSSPISDLRYVPSVPLQQEREVQVPQAVTRRGGSLSAPGEARDFDVQQQRLHARCHREVCTYWTTEPTVRVCLSAAQVKQFADKLLNVPEVDRVPRVITWAQAHVPTVPVLPANVMRYWDEQWDARARTEEGGSGVPGVAETAQRYLRRKAAGA